MYGFSNGRYAEVAVRDLFGRRQASVLPWRKRAGANKPDVSAEGCTEKNARGKTAFALWIPPLSIHDRVISQGAAAFLDRPGLTHRS